MRRQLTALTATILVCACGDPAGSATSTTDLSAWPDGLVIEDVVGENGDRCPVFTLDAEPLLFGDTCLPANFPPDVLAGAVWPRDDSKVYSLVSLPAEWSLADFTPAADDARVWFDGRAVVVVGPAQTGPEFTPTGTIALIRDDGLTASCELTLRRLDCD